MEVPGLYSTVSVVKSVGSCARHATGTRRALWNQTNRQTGEARAKGVLVLVLVLVLVRPTCAPKSQNSYWQ